jgi:hypothetical protein
MTGHNSVVTAAGTSAPASVVLNVTTTHTPTVYVVLVGIGTIVAITALAVAMWQARLARKASQSAALRDLMDRLQSASARQDRGLILDLRRGRVPYQRWDKDTRQAAERVAQSFNFAGILLQERMIPKAYLRNWHTTIIRCWETVKPLTLHLRVERDNDEIHRMFQWLAVEARASKPLGPVKGDKVVELVPEADPALGSRDPRS